MVGKQLGPKHHEKHADCNQETNNFSFHSKFDNKKTVTKAGVTACIRVKPFRGA